MKKILAILIIITSLFMKPLFAPVKADVLKDIATRQKEILAEKQRKVKEAEAKKAQEEREARELQKKLDELQVQEEKAQEEKAREKEAAEKKTKEEAEAAKQKKLAEDPRKNITDALSDLFAANKKYAAADAETNTVKKAEQIKSGDALFKRVVTGLYESLNNFSYEEIEKIVSTMELKPETQFMILQNLIEAYADHSKVLDVVHVKVFGDFIRVLFATVNTDVLSKFLLTEQGRRMLHGVQVMMLPIVEVVKGEKAFESMNVGEKFFATMVRFTEKLVEVLNKASVEQRQHLSDVLLDWVRHIPVVESINSEGILHAALRKLDIALLSDDASALRDWLLIFKNSKDKNFLQALGTKYIKAVYEEGNFGTLRDALIVLRHVLSNIIPFAEEVRLKIVFLKKASQTDVLKIMSDNDRRDVLKYLTEYITAQGDEAPMIWTMMSNNLDTVITSIEAERAKTAGTKRFADLGEQLKQFQAMEKQLAEIYSPSWLEQISTAGKLAWQKVAKAWKGQEKSFVPNFESWNEKEIGKVFFNITDENYKNFKFSSVDELIKSLSALRDAVKWYADFPEVQAFLKKWAQNFYDTRTFDDVAEHLYSSNWDQFFNFIKRLPDLQRIIFADYVKNSQLAKEKDRREDALNYIARHLVWAAMRSYDPEGVKNLSSVVLEHFIKGAPNNDGSWEFHHPADWRESGFDEFIEVPSAFWENLTDEAFGLIVKLLSEQQLNRELYMKPHRTTEGIKVVEDWYDALLVSIKGINPRRALALLDTFEMLNKSLKANKIDIQFNDTELKAARADAEKRLKVQQESEAKASAATSASTYRSHQE